MKYCITINTTFLITVIIWQSTVNVCGKCIIEKESVNCFGSTWKEDLLPIENDSLQKLNISKCSDSNKYASAFDISFIKNLSKLKLLSITECQLKRPPLIQDPINSVDTINLSNNLIDERSKFDALGMNFFKYLPNLKTVNLSKNRLKDLPKIWFDCSNHIEELILDDNLIRGLDPSLSICFKHLKKLSLRNNQFIFLRKKNELKESNLIGNKNVFMRSNNVPRLRSETFGAIRHESSKVISNQKSYNDIIPQFPNLETLDLSYNKIKSLDQIPLLDLKSLTTLILRGNRLLPKVGPKGTCDFGTAPFYIKSNFGLNHIDLSDNVGLSRIRSCWTFGLANLQILEVSNCSISNIQENAFEKMKSITRLDLSNNRLNEVPKELTAISSTLLDLNLSNNSISQLKSGNLIRMENLRILNLSHNKFQNLLTFLSSETDSKLQEVPNFQPSSDILESDEPIGLLSRMRVLEDLDISYNSLTKLSATTDLPPSVKINGGFWRINLDGNLQLTQLVNFNYEEITTKLSHFIIPKESRLICNCHLIGFIKWVIHRQNEVVARCGSPKHLEDQLITSKVVSDYIINNKSCSVISKSKTVKPVYKLKLFSNANRTTGNLLDGGPMNGNSRKSTSNQKLQTDQQNWAMIGSNITLRCEFYSSHQRYFKPSIEWQRITIMPTENIPFSDQNQMSFNQFLKTESSDKSDSSKFKEKIEILNSNFDSRIRSYQIGPLEDKLNLDKFGFHFNSDFLNNYTITFSGKPYIYVGYLIIQSLYMSDYGRYRCLVNDLPVNQFNGQSQLISKDEEIKIFSLPKFAATPSQHMSIIEGETAEITCRATGYPPPMTSLGRIGTKDFPAARGRRMIIYKDDSSFFITRVRQIDTGNYSCTSRNAAGTISHNFTLKVQIPATFIESAPSKISVSVGQPLVIRFKINGVPSPNIKWFKDGHKITGNDRLRFSADQLWLVIQSSIVEDSGIYNISILNALGGSEASVFVQVLDNVLIDKPSIQTPPNSGSMGSKESNGISDYWLSAIIIIVVLSILLTSILWITIFLCFGKLVGSKKRRLLLISNSQSKSSFDKCLTSTTNFTNPRNLQSNVCHIPLSLTTSTIVRHDQSKEECRDITDSEIASENLKTCSEFYSPQVSRSCFPEMQSTYSISNRIFHSQPYLTTSKLDLSNNFNRPPSRNNYKTVLKNEPCDSGIDSSHIYSETLNSSDISSIYKCPHKSKHKSNNPKRKRHQNINPNESSEHLKLTPEIFKICNNFENPEKEKNAQTSCKDYLSKQQSKSKKPCNFTKTCSSTPLIN